MIKSKPRIGGLNAPRLQSFVERYEKLAEERHAVGGDMKDVLSEAKGVGYDAKTIKWLVGERKIDAADRAERDALRDTYAHALGVAVELVEVGGLSLRQAASQAGVSKSSLHRALAVPEVSRVEMTAADLSVPFDTPKTPDSAQPANGPEGQKVPQDIRTFDEIAGPLPDFLRASP